ncbi:MAG: DEAD/DEAH box helicase, partial [Chloroflexota bacterium]|nr:DEAD/DEAH box helicase [Chloroflexota bacterium]
MPVARWKNVIFKKRNPDLPSYQEPSDSGRQQPWWQRFLRRMTQSTASAPFKESTHIDENAESIYGANRSASNATTEIIPSADTASARSTNGGRGGGDRVDSSDRRPKSRSSNSARNVNVKAEAQSQVSTNNPVRDLRDTGNESEMPGGEGEQSNERRGHKRSSRKESEYHPSVTLEKSDSYWFGAQEVSYDVALALKTIGYEEPTPIQTDCLAPLLDGNDVVGQAHTGTGKTAAFGIPMVEQVDPSQNFIQGLVLVPTRELAMQVRDEIARLGQYRKLGVIACYGGQPIARQITALNRNAQIVVGTPGRVLDHIGRGTLQLGDVRILVLDEADEMLDIGFLPDIERILGNTPRDRQTALFSATLPPPIRGIVGRHMKSPTWIRIGNEVETAPDVRQIYYEVLESDRIRACVELLKNQTKDGKVLLFRKTKSGVDNLTQALQRQGIKVVGIHGGLVQGERNAAMRSFHAGEIKVLVATNVAARGLDIPEISHVINYDMPQNLEEYVHRIGRTARMGKHG